MDRLGFRRALAAALTIALGVVLGSIFLPSLALAQPWDALPAVFVAQGSQAVTPLVWVGLTGSSLCMAATGFMIWHHDRLA